MPAYGPLNAVVPAATAENWLERLRSIAADSQERFVAIGEIAARTDDPARDIGEPARDAALSWLEQAGADDDIIRMVREPVTTHRAVPRLYGEPLPLGLRLDDWS